MTVTVTVALSCSAAIYSPLSAGLSMFCMNMISENTTFTQSANIDYSRYLIQYGLVVVATIPILCAFPFFQKYIEKGAVLGGVKE